MTKKNYSVEEKIAFYTAKIEALKSKSALEERVKELERQVTALEENVASMHDELVRKR